MKNDGSAFEGFSKRAFSYLAELKKNNNKEWFEKNREIYQTALLAPMRRLVSDLGEFMSGLDHNLDVTPAIGKTISRIYKDARRLRGGPPYKNSMWIVFKRPMEDWKESPAFYIEIFSDSYSYGMGIYGARREMMDLFRENMLKKPAEFLEAIKFYGREKQLRLFGDYYKKMKCPKGLSPELFEWYRKKSFYLSCDNPIDALIVSPKFVDAVMAAFARLAPLYHYLWKLKLKARAESEKHILKSYYA